MPLGQLVIWFLMGVLEVPGLVAVLPDSASWCCENAPAKPENGKDCEPIAKRSGTTVYVSPAKGCEWSDLIDLSLFAGFKPGMTVDEATAVVGEPNARIRSHYGPAWQYRRPAGLIQISHEDQSSLPFITNRRWVLRGFPLEKSPGAFLAPSVARQILSGTSRTRVVVLNGCGFAAAEIVVRGDAVAELVWIKNSCSWPWQPTSSSTTSGPKHP